MTAPNTEEQGANTGADAEGAEANTGASTSTTDAANESTTGAEGDEEGASEQTKSDEPAAAAEEAPVAKVAGPAAPAGYAHVDVPADVTAKLPPQTTVSMSPGNELTATVTRHGGLHTITAFVGAEFHHLVAEVEHYFGETFGG